MAGPGKSALLPRLVLTVAASLLGIGLSLVGLHLRVFGLLPALPPWLGPYDAVPRALGLGPAALAWPSLVIGLTWFGALAGLWLRLPWGRATTLLLSLVSALAVGAGTLLAAIVVVCLFLWEPVGTRQPSGE